MTFLELAERVLREEKKPLTAIEICNIGTKKAMTKNLIPMVKHLGQH